MIVSQRIIVWRYMKYRKRISKPKTSVISPKNTNERKLRKCYKKKKKNNMNHIPHPYVPIASKLPDVLLLQILSILVSCILRIAGFVLLLVKSSNPQSHHGDTCRIYIFFLWPLNIQPGALCVSYSYVYRYIFSLPETTKYRVTDDVFI